MRKKYTTNLILINITIYIIFALTFAAFINSYFPLSFLILVIISSTILLFFSTIIKSIIKKYKYLPMKCIRNLLTRLSFTLTIIALLVFINIINTFIIIFFLGLLIISVVFCATSLPRMNTR